MRRSKTLAFLAAGLAAASALACSSTTPEPTLYLLRARPEDRAASLEGARIGIGRVVVAPYLMASPGIVVETEPGVVRPARMHAWAEPVDQGLRWYLRHEVAAALGHDMGGGLVDRPSWDWAVDVYVSRLHGTMDGQALLESGYVIWPTRAPEPASEHVFTRQVPLQGEGYPALVDAERELLSALGRDIAAALAPLLEQGAAAAPGAATTGP